MIFWLDFDSEQDMVNRTKLGSSFATGKSAWLWRCAQSWKYLKGFEGGDTMLWICTVQVIPILTRSRTSSREWDSAGFDKLMCYQNVAYE
jgi:hypothetical protein